MSSSEAEQYKQDILAVTGRCDRLHARVRELGNLLNQCVSTYDEWGRRENTPWHDGAMDERIAACDDWQRAVDNARAALAGKGDGDE